MIQQESHVTQNKTSKKDGEALFHTGFTLVHILIQKHSLNYFDRFLTYNCSTAVHNYKQKHFLLNLVGIKLILNTAYVCGFNEVIFFTLWTTVYITIQA